jgi:hypothetical protein
MLRDAERANWPGYQALIESAYADTRMCRLYPFRLVTSSSGGSTADYNYDPFGRLDTVTSGGATLQSNTYDGFDKTPVRSPQANAHAEAIPEVIEGAHLTANSPVAVATVNATVQTPDTSASGDARAGYQLAWDLYDKTTGTWLSSGTSTPAPSESAVKDDRARLAANPAASPKRPARPRRSGH